MSDSSLAPPSPGPNFISTPPYSASVVYLLTTLPTDRPKESISRSLLLLQKNIPWRHQWPILLFHAGIYDSVDSQAQFLEGIRGAAAANNATVEDTEKLLKRIEFVHFKHDLPAGIPLEVDGYNPVFGDKWPGYHHMCAFFSYKIFTHPRIRDLTYYFRLDDDSFIREPACFDPLEYMHATNISFSFREQVEDPDYVTEGMWPFVSAYAQTHPDIERRMLANDWPWLPNRQAPDYGREASFPMFGGNFEIVKLSRFQTLEATAFLESLASDPERFYKFRWGDAPLRKATVYMLLDVAQEVHQMCEIAYGHKDYFVGPDCDCTLL
ncbi:glycosyltransferase family 15 protein [Mycena albidolilacea]|uniref:Glycosyltransferase family 15 protein n=1 Tax=Mycena albidolilacea TaxID=1033008 RepID=A0AAD7AVE9_9AGAR|nr:glycosyltransferase family 15 protein [Mycena albidolilacea]